MAERTVISGRGAMVVALAAVLGAAAGASWQRREAGGAGSRPGTPGGHDASHANGGGAGFTGAGFVPPGLIELIPYPKHASIPRDNYSNLFDYSESPEAKAIRLAHDRRVALERQHEKDEQDRLAKQKLADDNARAEADARWAAAHPRPPAVTLSLIGKIGAPRAPMAILAAADGEVFTARVGETIAGTFRLLSLDFETATIGYAPALVAAQPEWASARTVLRMGVR
jgi:hypothetical protein